MEPAGKIGNFYLYDITDILKKDAIEKKKCQAEGVAFYPTRIPELEQPESKITFVDVTDEFKKEAEGRRSEGDAALTPKNKGSKVKNFFRSVKNSFIRMKDRYDYMMELDRQEKEQMMRGDGLIRGSNLVEHSKNPIKFGDAAKKYIKNLANGLEMMFEAVPFKPIR